MHRLFARADEFSHAAIGAAIEVHRLKGPGLIESIYERCMLREFELRKIPTANQRLIRIEYKGFVFEEPLRFDLLLEDCLLLELKSVEKILPIHKAQLTQLYEVVGCAAGIVVQLPRNETHRRHLPNDSPQRKSAAVKPLLHLFVLNSLRFLRFLGVKNNFVSFCSTLFASWFEQQPEPARQEAQAAERCDRPEAFVVGNRQNVERAGKQYDAHQKADPGSG